MSEREFDVVVFGASGYTGKLVVEYMHKEYEEMILLSGLSLVEINKSFLL
jgi:short subunit dehydrogenase-like uncharacterized protein